MPSSPLTGRVAAICSKPTRGARIVDGRNAGVEVTFENLDADDWALLVAAYNSGKTVTVSFTVSGSPPNQTYTCTGVSQP